jgi:hypothetical protein
MEVMNLPAPFVVRFEMVDAVSYKTTLGSGFVPQGFQDEGIVVTAVHIMPEHIARMLAYVHNELFEMVSPEDGKDIVPAMQHISGPAHCCHSNPLTQSAIKTTWTE